MAQSLGEKIAMALTKNQMIHLLDRFFQISDAQHQERLLSTLDEDVGGTLSQLIQAEAVLETPIISDEKLAEEWNNLWGEWHSFTSELGDEEGR